MSDQQAKMLRTKMVGALIRKTRQDRGLTVEDLAQAIALDPDELSEYESGNRGIPLPDLELICHHFDVEIQDILSNKPPVGKPSEAINPGAQRSLRQRLIAVQLRKLRQDHQTELDQAAQSVGLSTETLEAYERGQQPIPLAELEALSTVYGATLEQFLAHEGPLAQIPSAPTPEPAESHLPKDLQDFVNQAENLPYLRLAMALRKMPEEELRQFAQSLIEGNA